ncbi:MAG: monovalent cation/H(+) antiporter subunit G [Rhodospirillales bacterium]
MALLVDALSWVLLVIGSVMLIIGGVGIVRLPDVFARMHGLGIVDTLGVGAVMVGLMFQAGFTIVTIKLVLITIFMLFTSPTTTHALARAALNGGVQPRLDVPDGEEPDAEAAPDRGGDGDTEGEPSSKT